MAHSKSDSGWAWMIVIGVTIINLSVLPLQQCFGLIFGERFTNLGITATQTSLILHLNGTITCSLGLISGPMMKTFSFRKVAFFGGLIVAIGVWSTAFALSLATIIISYCIVIGVGQGIIYPATSLAISTYFRKKRSVAMGFTITLTGLGPIVMPILIDRLLETYATTGTLIIFAGIAANSFIGASLLTPFKENHQTVQKHVENENISVSVEKSTERTANTTLSNEQKDDNTDVESSKMESERFLNPKNLRNREHETKDSPRNNDETDHKNTVLKSIAKNLDLALLRDKRYIAVVLGMGISLVAETNFNAILPFILTELAGLERSVIATVMSVQAAFDITGRLCVPLLAQKTGWTSRNLFVVSLLGFTLARTILSTWGNHYSVVIGVAVIVGLSKGTKAVFQALIIPDYVPLERLPAASGIQMVCNGILSILIGPLIGLVHDCTNSYVGALHFTSTLSLSCVILWIIGGLWTFPGSHKMNILDKTNKGEIVQNSVVEV